MFIKLDYSVLLIDLESKIIISFGRFVDVRVGVPPSRVGVALYFTGFRGLWALKWRPL